MKIRKSQKKVLATLLVVALVLTMIPPVAFAESEPEGIGSAESVVVQNAALAEQDTEFTGLLEGDDSVEQSEPAVEQTEPISANDPDESTIEGPDNEDVLAPDASASIEDAPDSALVTLAEDAPEFPEASDEEPDTLDTLTAGDLPIDETTFPDDNFRAWLLDGRNINDSGADAVLTSDEIADITIINVNDKGIADLTGIQYFTALTFLNCSNNQLAFLDLSGLASLTYLDCYNNQLTSLDVSGYTGLQTLYCAYNQLTSLDLSGLAALTELYCYNNQLTSLDLTGLAFLLYLSCENNQLTSLDASGLASLTELYCSDNQLTSLDASSLASLTRLSCYGNQLTSLDLSDLTSLTNLGCHNNRLTSLDLSGLPSLTELYCSGNQLTSLDASGLASLTQLSCDNNQLLDVSGLPDALRYFRGSSQAVAIPVHADSTTTLGSYLSDAAYDFGAHAITLDGTDADFDATAGLFIATVLDAPVSFVIDVGRGYQISGTVTFVSDSLSSDKDITSFVLAGVTGTIDGTSIDVTVPYGTNVTSLDPTIIHTGVNISPTGAQDFTSPVAYTVSAEDATTKDYTVTVTISTSVPIISVPFIWTGIGAAIARINALFKDFVRVMLNGVEVSPSNYTVSEGSTVITFNEEYLNTLADGDYTFTAVFTNGTADIPLKISTHSSDGTGSDDKGNQSTMPATGDANSLALAVLAGLLLVSGVMFLAREHRLRRLF
jgi:hypothetical protein